MPTAKTSNFPSYGSADNYSVNKKALGYYGRTAMGVGIAVGLTALMQYVNANPTTYPNLKTAATNTGIMESPAQSVTSAAPMAIGQVFRFNGTLYKITGNYSINSYLEIDPRTPPANPQMGGGLFQVQHDFGTPYGSLGQYQPCRQDKYYYTTATAPTPTAATESMFSANMQTAGELKDAINAELGIAIAANPSLATFPNTAVKQNADAAQGAKSAETTAAAQAQAAAATAAAQANYNANPTAANLAALEAAKAAEKTLLDQQARDDLDKYNEQKAKEDDVAAPVPANAPLHTINFQPMDGLKDALSSTYPFNLPTSITTYFNRFLANPEAPSFDLPMPGQNTLHVDLAVFNPIAEVFRYLGGLIITIGMFIYIVHFFRGIA